VHLFKGAEIRLKLWRAQRGSSGSGGGGPPFMGGGGYRDDRSGGGGGGGGGWDSVGLTEPFDGAADAYGLASQLARAHLGGGGSIWSAGNEVYALPPPRGVPGAPDFPPRGWVPPPHAANVWGGR
jgi:hypothetical protein